MQNTLHTKKRWKKSTGPSCGASPGQPRYPWICAQSGRPTWPIGAARKKLSTRTLSVVGQVTYHQCELIDGCFPMPPSRRKAAPSKSAILVCTRHERRRAFTRKKPRSGLKKAEVRSQIDGRLARTLDRGSHWADKVLNRLTQQENERANVIKLATWSFAAADDNHAVWRRRRWSWIKLKKKV